MASSDSQDEIPPSSSTTENKVELNPSETPTSENKQTSDLEQHSETTDTSNYSSWGWGDWNSVITSIQEVAAEAQKTASDAAKEVLQQLETESPDYKPVTESTPLVAKELETGLISLDQSVESLASNALHALGNAFQGGLNLIPSLEPPPESSEKPHPSPSFSPSLPSFSSLPSLPPLDASSFLQSSVDLANQGLQILENVSRETVEAIAHEAGIELEPFEEPSQGSFSGAEANLGPHTPQPVAPGEGEGEEEEEEDSFERCFYIYGGPVHFEDLQAISDHHSLLWARGLSKVSQGDRVQLQELLEAVNEKLGGELPSPKGETPSIPPPIGEDYKGALEGSREAAKDLKAQIPQVLSGLSGPQLERAAEGHLKAIRSEAIHRVSETSAMALAVILQKAREFPSEVSGESSEKKAERARLASGEIIELSGYLSGDLSTAAQEFLQVMKSLEGQSSEKSGEEEGKILEGLKEAEAAILEAVKGGKGKIEEATALLPPVLLSQSLKGALVDALGEPSAGV